MATNNYSMNFNYLATRKGNWPLIPPWIRHWVSLPLPPSPYLFFSLTRLWGWKSKFIACRTLSSRVRKHNWNSKLSPAAVWLIEMDSYGLRVVGCNIDRKIHFTVLVRNGKIVYLCIFQQTRWRLQVLTLRAQTKNVVKMSWQLKLVFVCCCVIPVAAKLAQSLTQSDRPSLPIVVFH